MAHRGSIWATARIGPQAQQRHCQTNHLTRPWDMSPEGWRRRRLTRLGEHGRAAVSLEDAP